MSSKKSTPSTDQLQEFRQLLLKRRQEFTETLGQLERDVREYNEPEARNVQSDVPTHPADQSDREYEQAKDLHIASMERGMIRQIDEALRRIEDGSYGICLVCQQPIQRRRLLAEPWAQLCIDDAR